MSGQQFDRQINLIVADASGSGLDLRRLKCRFAVGRSDAETPNWADITVWNLAQETALRIKKEFTRVTLQAGYPGNVGVIFSGTIKQVRIIREDGANTCISIAAGDGDQAYNNSVVSATLAPGATLGDQIKTALAPMAAHGVTEGFLEDLGGPAYPRGKVLYGMSRDYVRQAAQSAGATWSIQDGKVQVIKRTGLLPGQAIAINSRSGMIGSPTQTENGIEVRCLLNPMLRIGGAIKLEQDSIVEAQLQAQKASATAEKTSPLSANGLYRLYLLKHIGDTRDNDWYSDLVCLSANQTAPAGQEVDDE